MEPGEDGTVQERPAGTPDPPESRSGRRLVLRRQNHGKTDDHCCFDREYHPADLMEKVVRIARELGREIATPDEARKILGLKGRDKVNY
jgi:hypothetical protein